MYDSDILTKIPWVAGNSQIIIDFTVKPKKIMKGFNFPLWRLSGFTICWEIDFLLRYNVRVVTSLLNLSILRNLIAITSAVKSYTVHQQNPTLTLKRIISIYEYVTRTYYITVACLNSASYRARACFYGIAQQFCISSLFMEIGWTEESQKRQFLVIGKLFLKYVFILSRLFCSVIQNIYMHQNMSYTKILLYLVFSLWQNLCSTEHASLNLYNTKVFT